MSKIIPDFKSFDYDIAFRAEMPEKLKHFRDKAKSIIESFNTIVENINESYKSARAKLEEEKKKLREHAITEYKLFGNFIDGEWHYWVERTKHLPDELEIPESDKEFYKKIEYIGFVIRNDVFITSRKVGGNHIFFENGIVLSLEEIEKIRSLEEVPQRLIDTKPVF